MILDKFFREAKFAKVNETEKHDPYFILSDRQTIKNYIRGEYYHTLYIDNNYKPEGLWEGVRVYTIVDNIDKKFGYVEVFISFMGVPFLSSRIKATIHPDITELNFKNYSHTWYRNVFYKSNLLHGLFEKFKHAISSATPSLLPTKKEMENLIEEIQALNTMDRIKNL